MHLKTIKTQKIQKISKLIKPVISIWTLPGKMLSCLISNQTKWKSSQWDPPGNIQIDQNPAAGSLCGFTTLFYMHTLVSALLMSPSLSCVSQKLPSFHYQGTGYSIPTQPLIVIAAGRSSHCPVPSFAVEGSDSDLQSVSELITSQCIQFREHKLC